MEGQSSPLVVVLGGINMDLVTYAPNFPQAGETVVGSSFLTYPGGKGANQAVAVARMEARAAMVGRVGTDIFGPQLVDLLRDSGVDAHGVRYASGVSSGIAVINVDQTAQNRIIQVLGANAECGEAEAARVIELLPQAGALMLQTGGIPGIIPQRSSRGILPGENRHSGPGPHPAPPPGVLPLL